MVTDSPVFADIGNGKATFAYRSSSPGLTLHIVEDQGAAIAGCYDSPRMSLWQPERVIPSDDANRKLWMPSTRDYFSVISRMSLVPMISRISRRFTCIACC